MTTKIVFHGSDIEKICDYYHLNKEDIVKFGANVNPLGLSASVKKEIAENVDLFSSYPDRDYVSLRNTISEYCRIPAEFILPGNGSSELISLLIQERAPKHTLILGPTYSEYSRELSFSGSTQEYYHLREERNFTLDVEDLCKTLENGYDFLILCNPNNPTGISIDREFLFRVLRVCREMDILLVVDECFLDFMEEPGRYTLKAQLSRYHNLFLLKAFTKRYAMAGIRLGYGITENTELLDAMTQVTQPWNISVMAQAAGIAALKETAYVEEGRQMVFREAKYLKEELQRLGMEVFPSEANYIFFHGPENLFEICVEQGVLIRDCSNYSGLRKGYYRVAVRTHEENQELIRAMRDGTTKAAVAHAEVLKEEEQA